MKESWCLREGRLKALRGFFLSGEMIFLILYSVVSKMRILLLILLCYISRWMSIGFEKLGCHRIPSFGAFNATLISQIRFVLPSHKLLWIAELEALLYASLLSLQLSEGRSKHHGGELCTARMAKTKGCALGHIPDGPGTLLFSATGGAWNGTHW